jgi:PAS domain S-box-containing protein
MSLKPFWMRSESWSMWVSVLATLGLGVGYWLLPHHFKIPSDEYLTLHTTLEVLVVMLAIMVWSFTWALRDARPLSYTLLGICFLYSALMCFAHALSFEGMPAWITPGSPEKAIYFWLLARYFAVVGVLGYAFGTHETGRGFKWLGVMSMCFVLAVVSSWLVLYRLDDLPRMFIAGAGLTPAKIASEWVLFLMFVVAAIGLFGWRQRHSDANRYWLASAAYILGLGELIFTLYAEVNDALNLMGHVYNLVGLSVIGRVLFKEAVIEPRIKLQEARSKLELTLTSARAGAWTWNLVTGQASADDQWKSLLGYSPNELDPQHVDTWVQMVHQEDLPELQSKLKEYLRGHVDHYAVEYRVRMKSGEWRWVRDQGAAAVWDQNGRVEVMSGLLMDVHRRKTLEIGLRTQRDLNQLYLDTVDAVIIRLDADGRLQMINRKGLELFGYQESEMIGMNWFMQCLNQPEGMSKIYPSYVAVMQGRLQGDTRNKISVRTAQGLIVQLVWHHSFVRDETGRFTGAITAGIDLSEEMRVQEQLARQLKEVRLWQDAMLDREGRIMELKAEVNELLLIHGQSPRYGQTD